MSHEEPCPCCGEMLDLEIENIDGIQDGDSDWLQCPECDHDIRWTATLSIAFELKKFEGW